MKKKRKEREKQAKCMKKCEKTMKKNDWTNWLEYTYISEWNFAEMWRGI